MDQQVKKITVTGMGQYRSDPDPLCEPLDLQTCLSLVEHDHSLTHTCELISFFIPLFSLWVKSQLVRVRKMIISSLGSVHLRSELTHMGTHLQLSGAWGLGTPSHYSRKHPHALMHQVQLIEEGGKEGPMGSVCVDLKPQPQIHQGPRLGLGVQGTYTQTARDRALLLPLALGLFKCKYSLGCY